MNKKSKGLLKNVLSTKLGREESGYYRKGITLLVGYRQKITRKPMYLVTTAYPANDELIKIRKSGIEAIKPSLIHEYNLHMGGVDVKDKSIYHITSIRPTSSESDSE